MSRTASPAQTSAPNAPRTQDPPVQTQDPPLEERPHPNADWADEVAAALDAPRAKAAADEAARQARAHAGNFWPKGEPLPKAYVKPRALPCPKCRRVKLDDGGRAVACVSSTADIAYFRCKGCGNRWPMPVKEA